MRPNLQVPRKLAYTLVTTLMLAATTARAWTDLRIVVKDPGGAPLAGATFWFAGEALSGKPFEADRFASLVLRYAPDVDFMCSDGPVSEIMAERADESGNVEMDLEPREVRAIKRMPLHIAVFKRGFAPQVLTALHGVGSEVTVVKLEPLSTAPDAELLEFDRLLMRANLARLGKLGESAGARESKSIRTELTTLAERLRRENREDAASVVYFGISCMPAIDFSESPNGIVVHGYTNGFSDSDAWRVEARNLARQLNRSNPQLRFDAMFARYKSPSGITFIGSWMAPEDRKRLITDTEKLRAAHADQLWPRTYTALWTAYVREGDYAAGCRVIQGMYASMSHQHDTGGWQELLKLYEGTVHDQDKSANAECLLPGLTESKAAR